MRRGVRALLGTAALLIALVAAAEPSFAEGLLRRLFGGFVARLPEYRFNFNRMGPAGYGSEEGYDGGSWQEDFGSYRTLCVRLCDGFYFPISDGVRRERLYSDAHQCAQRCDGEARLFYYPTTGGSPETMVDLAGHRYADLPNAFRYRKALVDACTCKPAPWSQESAARHERYAAEAAQHGAESAPTDGWRSTAQAQASREASRGPSPYDSEPSRAYGRGPQSPWDRPQDRAQDRPQDRGGDGREPRPSYGWDHD
jgi:uncharacterized protein DUF2865